MKKTYIQIIILATVLLFSSCKETRTDENGNTIVVDTAGEAKKNRIT